MSKKRLQETAWSEFVAWCALRGLEPMPANPWTLAAFALWCETQMLPPTIRDVVAAIGLVHAEKSRRRPDRDPLIARTLKMIEMRAEKKAQHAGLFDADDVVSESEEKSRKPAKSQKRPAVKKAETGRRKSLRSEPKLVSKRRLNR